MKDNKPLFKVAGTTFHPLPQGKNIVIEGESYQVNDVPTAHAKAILSPEPDNAYDPDAVQVFVKLNTGEPFHIGYIGKDEPWKTKITEPTIATLRISDYTDNGYNPSYAVIAIGQ